MASNDSTSTLAARMMPSLAILHHELRSLRTSWLVKLWLVAVIALTLLILAIGWGHLQTAPFISLQLAPFLVFPWCLVVMVLGVTPMSGGRAEEMADGILCRPVTRHEYLLAAWAARVVLVLGVYLLVLVPAILLIALAKRPTVPPDSATAYGICAGLGAVGLVLTFQVSLGFLLGTLLRSTLLAIVVLLFVWLPVNAVLDTFSLETFSPISLDRAMPRLLRTPWSELDAEAAAAASEDPESVGAWMESFAAAFSVPKANKDPKFFQREGYDDFSLTWVLLAYAAGTLLAINLATGVFCLRDL
jgi:ABC-type transport system involved in multi-copper enzyme maturation permease subunit